MRKEERLEEVRRVVVDGCVVRTRHRQDPRWEAGVETRARE